MMNYEIFKEVVRDKILDYLPSSYEGSRVDIIETNKVNKVRDGLTIHMPDSNISPTIYVNDMYEEYERTEDLQGILTKTAEMFEKAMKHSADINTDISSEDTKEKIVFQLINTEQNKELLKTVPNREFQDLSIVYRIVMAVDGNGIQSALVNERLMENMKLTEDELFKLAAENTKRIFPPTVRSMNEVIRDIFMADGMPEEIAEMMMEEMPADQGMWVISNEKGINGATSMLYENGLNELAEKLDSDLYILPSSLHEVIAVSANMGDPEELAKMVAEINMEDVKLEERLSNQVYHYDKDLRKLTLATDTPNKRLDEIVAEQNLVYETKKQLR